MSKTRTLQELVRQAQLLHNRSLRGLATLAQEHGHKIVYTTLSQIQAGTYKSTPTPGTLQAIAWLAQVPNEIAYKAAGQPPPGPPFAQELPEDVDRLSPRKRKAVLEMIRILLASDDTPTTEPQDEKTPTSSTSKVVTRKRLKRPTEIDKETKRLMDNL